LFVVDYAHENDADLDNATCMPDFLFACRSFARILSHSSIKQSKAKL